MKNTQIRQVVEEEDERWACKEQEEREGVIE